MTLSSIVFSSKSTMWIPPAMRNRLTRKKDCSCSRVPEQKSPPVPAVSSREVVAASDRSRRRRRMEPTLLDELAAACPDWLFATDREMRLIYASDRLTWLAGERASWRAPGQGMRRRGAIAGLKATPDMHGGAPAGRANRAPGAARGGLRYWQINAKPVFDSTGDFIGYRGRARRHGPSPDRPPPHPRQRGGGAGKLRTSRISWR